MEAVKERIRPYPEGSFAVGASIRETLLGTAGLRRLDGKERHKAQVWRVYVTERAGCCKKSSVKVAEVGRLTVTSST